MSSLILPRRRFLAGLAAAFSAPAIVRAESLMPVRAMKTPEVWKYYQAAVDMGGSDQMVCVLMASFDNKNWTVIGTPAVERAGMGFSIDMKPWPITTDTEINLVIGR